MLFNVCQNTKIKSKIIYSESESELDFSFAINSVSDFDSASESDSESDSSSEFMNLWIYEFMTSVFFLLYIYILLNKLADEFFYSFS